MNASSKTKASVLNILRLLTSTSVRPRCYPCHPNSNAWKISLYFTRHIKKVECNFLEREIHVEKERLEFDKMEHSTQPLPALNFVKKEDKRQNVNAFFLTPIPLLSQIRKVRQTF